jgi:hypothetical protein
MQAHVDSDGVGGVVYLFKKILGTSTWDVMDVRPELVSVLIPVKFHFLS